MLFTIENIYNNTLNVLLSCVWYRNFWLLENYVVFNFLKCNLFHWKWRSLCLLIYFILHMMLSSSKNLNVKSFKWLCTCRLCPCIWQHIMIWNNISYYLYNWRNWVLMMILKLLLTSCRQIGDEAGVFWS